MSQSADRENTPGAKPHYWIHGAILIDMNTIFGGKGLGLESPIATKVHVHVHKETTETSWLGFTIEVPYGPNAEDDGFGICHEVVNLDGRVLVASNKTFKIVVNFPSTAYSFVEELRPDLLSVLPKLDQRMCRLDVSLAPGDHSVVKGYRLPVSHPGEQFEAFITKNAPEKIGLTLVEILQRREFSFIVAAPSIAMEKNWCQPLPPPPRYPYGEDHSWSLERYDDILPKTRGPQFLPAWTFDNDNEHLAALTQSQVQDVMWIHNASKEIGETFFRAYFITSEDQPKDCKEFHVIVPLGTEFLDRYEQPWLRLTKSGFLKLRLFDDEDDESPAEWDARIEDVFSMAMHPVDINDLVLQVRRPRPKEVARRPDFEVKVFKDRRSATIALRQDRESWNCVSLQFDDLLRDYIRKVDAVNLFSPEAQPSNPVACGIPKTVADAARVTRPPIPEELQFKMALHRALLRGNGFFDVLVPRLNDEGDATGQLADASKKAHLEGDDEPRAELSPLPSLPVLNLIDLPQEHIGALIEEILPDDRQRIVKYMATRPLGLTLVAAGPGFGKTTVLAVITLAMTATIGKVYATAPTNVATDNFAERLDRVSQRVTNRRNKGKASGDKTRARRTFIMRGFKSDEEYEAFINTLRDPYIGDKAAPNHNWSPDSKWTLHLSPSFWLLMALRSDAVRELHEDNHPGIQAVQSRLDKSAACERLRAVATRAISWEECQSGEMVQKSFIHDIFTVLLQSVDILCTTPALSCQEPFKRWKEEHAHGIAVDEAGNISRPDLYSVWGNTLLPCLLVGDDKQFPPATMTLEDKDLDGNHLNRPGKDGKISALEFFKSSGWPVFRLRTQLRMAKGLFDTCHREMYSDLPLKYGMSSNLANHPAGKALEGYLIARFPRLLPSPASSIREIFVHCPGSICIVDEATKSKRNPDQVNNALEFLGDLVKRSTVHASSIAIISPYKSNVGLIERRRKDPKHSALSAMPPAATVDSFQGREADIMVVIMGTTERVGPGLTTDENRLNVMLSRQKSGLLIFGNINVLGDVKDKGRNKAVLQVTEDGKQQFLRKGMLFRVLQSLHKQGRVVTLPVRARK